MDPRAQSLLAALRAHEPSNPEERSARDRMLAFVASRPDPFSRAHPEHVTGSAVVAKPDGSAFLLVHHRRLARWLQPGGHTDPEDAGVLETALREAREETGAKDLAVACGGRILDLDVHPIPAFENRPAHVHYDVRFLATSQDDAGPGEVEEVTGVAWFTLEEALAAGVDGSLSRSLRKAGALLREEGVEREAGGERGKRLPSP